MKQTPTHSLKQKNKERGVSPSTMSKLPSPTDAAPPAKTISAMVASGSEQATHELLNGHVDALSQTLTNFGRHARYASEQVTLLQDADTAAIFTEIARGIDTWLWSVQTSRQADS